MSVIGDVVSKVVYRRLTNPKSIARETLKLVLAEDHYDQGVWLSSGFFSDSRDWEATATGTELRSVLTENVCGTTCCVAGSVVVLTLPAKGRYSYHDDKVTMPGKNSVRVSEYAADRLGISQWDADWLFDGNRSKAEVVAALELLVKGESITGLYYDDTDDDYDDYDDDDEETYGW